MDQETPAQPRRLARSRSAQSGARRNSQLRIVSWVTPKPRSRSSAATSRKLSVYRRRQSTASRTISVGYWRSLKGVPVRSLKRRRQAWQRNRREPSAVRPLRLVVAVDAQSGQASSVPSPFRG